MGKEFLKNEGVAKYGGGEEKCNIGYYMCNWKRLENIVSIITLKNKTNDKITLDMDKNVIVIKL